MPITQRNLMVLFLAVALLSSVLAPMQAGKPGMLVDLVGTCIATLFLAIAILIGRVHSNRSPGNSRVCIRVRT